MSPGIEPVWQSILVSCKHNNWLWHATAHRTRHLHTICVVCCFCFLYWNKYCMIVFCILKEVWKQGITTTHKATLKLPFRKPSSGNHVASDNFLLGRKAGIWSCKGHGKTSKINVKMYMQPNGCIKICFHFTHNKDIVLVCFLPELLLMRCNRLRFGQMMSTGSVKLTCGLPGGYYYRENWHLVL